MYEWTSKIPKKLEIFFIIGLNHITFELHYQLINANYLQINFR